MNSLPVLAVLALVLYRQTRARRVFAPSAHILALIMIAIGLLSGGVVDPRHTGLSVVLLVVETVSAVVLGVVRALTVRIWWDETGRAWFKGTRWTMLGWLASILVRFGLLGVGHVLGVAAAPTTFLLFVGLTFGAQSVVVAQRARALHAPAVLVAA
ncbi:hypothetical protein GCM10023194_12230 [Planotetraspora phitsanulokensis]|uniref:DUF1453 domain-containing protein n=2 Tax=Planotetraspora phitsanulokensis TaxID=575192 RepID=A0A8J3XIU8_9ACTN|nr:hypothetical protein Pph01_63190 [Planotetraspora phitsanulokensis]